MQLQTVSVSEHALLWKGVEDLCSEADKQQMKLEMRVQGEVGGSNTDYIPKSLLSCLQVL